jgi:hypothetical protein
MSASAAAVRVVCVTAWRELPIVMGLFDRRWQEEHPERYEPNAGWGYHLEPGATETRWGPDAEGRPIAYEVRYQLRNLRDQTERVPGSERLLPYTFRVMAEEEWQGARRNGYIQSDGRGNLVASEGTVTKPSWSGTFYMVRGINRIVRLRIAPGDSWRVDPADSYIKTPDRIPLVRVDLISLRLLLDAENRLLVLPAEAKAAAEKRRHHAAPVTTFI